ncbi:MAG: DedA family protein [Microbacteriaceae bacterium]|nr:DedA family protein [Microbacteriaceae bacterium]
MHQIFTAALANVPANTGGNGGWLQNFVDWIVGLMNAIGAIGVGIGIALETFFPPIPSELLLPLAGFTAGQPGSKFGVIEAIIWATVGSVVGAYALYWIGRAIGHDRTVAFFSKIPFMSRADVEKTIAWFNRHGKAAVFFGRMLPLFRSLISIPAGVEKMSQGAFLLLTAAGSLIWNAVWILAGFWLGDNWEQVGDIIDRFKYVIIGILAILIIIWLIRKIIKRKQATPGSSDSESS